MPMGFPKDLPAGKYSMGEESLSWSGDDFSIQDEHGETVLESNADLFGFGYSFTARCPTSGEDLFTLKKGIIDETTYTIEPGSGGDTLFTISKDIFSFTDRIHVYKGEDVSLFGSEDPIITVDADWLSGWNRTFYEGNGSKVIAEGSQDPCPGLCQKQSYSIEVFKGASTLLVIATMLVVDEIKEDQGVDEN
jgi:uncharacterized protein YxjI